MEVFTLMLHRRVRDSSNFTYHRYCSKLELINLCFADDLFLFAHGDVNSASIIKEALDEFKDASGLNPSMPKSKAYFCNVINHTKLAILHVLPFEEDRLPVNYLGVPLVSSRLIFRDCKEIIDKDQNRVNDWKNKSLSVARSNLSYLFWALLMFFGLRFLFFPLVCCWILNKSCVVFCGVKVAWVGVKQKSRGRLFAFLKRKVVLVFVVLITLIRPLWCRIFGSSSL